VPEFLGTAGIRTVLITAKEAEAALDAFPGTARAGDTQPNSTLATALPMPSDHTMLDCDRLQRTFTYPAQKDGVSPSIAESRISNFRSPDWSKPSAELR
jgi:hypothetical protein